MKKHRRSLAVTLLHWIWVGAVCASFISGQRIGLDNANASLTPQQLDYSRPAWQDWLPAGAVFEWHRASGLLLAVSLAGYLILLVFSRRFRILQWRWQDSTPKASHYFFIWLGLVLLSAQLATGTLLAAELENLPGVLVAHRWLSWLILAYLLVHPTVSIIYLGWRRSLSILTGSLNGMWLASGCLALAMMAAYIAIGRYPLPLNVAYSEFPPRIDGDPGDSVWQLATPVTVITRHGNLDRTIPVSVKALQVGERIYFQLRWPDSSIHREHLSMAKATDGWRILATTFSHDDERIYYEDKLALMLSDQSLFDAMRSIHLGMQPLAGEPVARHRRGFHYTSSGKPLDIWHWKSVRTNHLSQADDNYFSMPQPALACAPRYTAGYQQDPSRGGGYTANYRFYDQRVTPLRLPTNIPAAAEKYWMRWPDGRPWTEQQDQTLEPGTRIPGIISKGPLQGDRGQVGARGNWQQGYWQLELSRALNTGSPFDTAIGEQTLLWIAVFDNAQTRHSYHLRPLQLRWNNNDD